MVRLVFFFITLIEQCVSFSWSKLWARCWSRPNPRSWRRSHRWNRLSWRCSGTWRHRYSCCRCCGKCSCWCRRRNVTNCRRCCRRHRRRLTGRRHCAAPDFCRAQRRAVAAVTACQPNVARTKSRIKTVGVGREIAPRGHERGNKRINRPAVTERIIYVHFVGRVGSNSTATHYQHLPAKGKRTCLACCPRYGCNRADTVSGRIEAKRISGVNYRAARVVRSSSHIDDAIYAACRRIHDPYRRVHSLYPLGAYGSSGIKFPYLVGGGYVDVEPAQDV